MTPLRPPPDTLDFRLLNDFQRDLPLVSTPYAAMAARLGCDEATVLTRLAHLQAEGCVSRVGPVFSPRRVGASTLAALAVPTQRLEAGADMVSACPEVNHNYQREHDWNLWFVATAEDEAALAACLGRLRAATRCPLIALPLEAEYHIDLGFDLAAGTKYRHGTTPRIITLEQHPPLADPERQLMAALQAGLALEPQPFRSLAERLDQNERAILATLNSWIAAGIVKRFGVVVRHHELGYQANAMCVWNVPDVAADELGQRLAAEDGVTLCYRRRRAAGWPFNLYCMIHGRDRAAVLARLAALRRDCGLADWPGEVLFSCRRFKQRGAHYIPEPEARRAHG